MRKSNVFAGECLPGAKRKEPEKTASIEAVKIQLHVVVLHLDCFKGLIKENPLLFLMLFLFIRTINEKL